MVELADNPLGLWARLRRRKVALVLSLLVTASCLWMLNRGALPVVPSREILSGGSPLSGPVYGGLFLIVLCLRAVRWRYLVRPLARLREEEILAANFVFFGAVLVLPLRLGEFVRPALLRRPSRLSAWQVIGLVGAERIVDGLFSSGILLCSLLLSPRVARTDLSGAASLVRPMAYLMVSVFGVALLVAVAFYFFRGPARLLTERILGIASPRLARDIADKVEKVAAGLEFLSHPRSAIPFVGISAIYWAANVAAAWALLMLVGITDATWAHAGTLIGVLALGLLVPGAPGFFGTFQLSAYAGLSLYVAPEVLSDAGARVVFWMYLAQVLVILGSSLAFLPLSLRRLAAAGEGPNGSSDSRSSSGS